MKAKNHKFQETALSAALWGSSLPTVDSGPHGPHMAMYTPQHTKLKVPKLPTPRPAAADSCSMLTNGSKSLPPDLHGWPYLEPKGLPMALPYA